MPIDTCAVNFPEAPYEAAQLSRRAFAGKDSDDQ